MKIKVRTASDVRDHYAEVMEDARFRDTWTVIKRHGQGVAIVVNLDWYEAHRDAEDPSAEAPAEADQAPGLAAGDARA